MQLIFHQSCLETTLRSFYKSVWHVRSKKFVPYGEEWLRIIELGALELMMNVMVSSVILEKQMEDITRQPESTMIINRFDHSKAEKDYSSTCSHSGNKK